MHWYFLGVVVLATAYMGIGTEVAMRYSQRLRDDVGRTMLVPPIVRVQIMFLWPRAIWDSQWVASIYHAAIIEGIERRTQLDREKRPDNTIRPSD
jgi:hypothetical protein